LSKLTGLGATEGFLASSSTLQPEPIESLPDLFIGFDSGQEDTLFCSGTVFRHSILVFLPMVNAKLFVQH
jgi:hypothetical protein